MKVFLTITIDVEPDCSSNWVYSDPLTFRGVSEGIQQRLQPLFGKYNMVPTYLINNVVLEDAASTRVFQSLEGNFELGTHLHPEFIAPQKEHENYAGKKGIANCCFYPPEIETGKLQNITHLFTDNFGYAPVSFRAGRYSAGLNTIRSLASLGYKVDTSVTPHLIWNDKTREQPVDFRQAPEQPYFIGAHSMTTPDAQSQLLEVPVGIAAFKRNPMRELLVSGAGLRHKMRSHKHVWLRPHYATADQMIEIAKQFTNRYHDNDTVVLNMMFHNVEVLPGLSPYCATEADCTRYLHSLETFFQYCNQNQIQGISLQQLYEHYASQS
jgi:hypothetical protein